MHDERARRALHRRFSPTAIFGTDPLPFPDGKGKHAQSVVTVTNTVVVPPPTSSATTSSTPETTSTFSSPSTSSTSTSSTLIPTTYATPTYIPPLPATTIQTETFPVASTLPASGTATATSAPSSSTSIVPVVGGVAGALVGFAVIALAILYFAKRKRGQDESEFDAQAFKRQSAVIPDDSNPYGASSRSRQPRPPTMIERRMQDAPPASYNNNYQQQNSYPPQGNNSYPPYGQQDYGAPNPIAPSFVPGQVVPGLAPTPVDSFFGQSPQTSPSVPYYESQYDSSGRLIAEPQQRGAHLSRSDTIDHSHPAHYVDLARSSISPFQAAQYAEISRRLKSETSSNPNSTQLAPPEDDHEMDERTPHVSINDFPAVPDTGDSDRLLFAQQAGLRPPQYGDTGTPNTYGSSFYSSDERESTVGPGPGSAVDPSRDSDVPLAPPRPFAEHASRGDSGIPDITLDGDSGSVRGYYDEFPVSALANSFVLPSPVALAPPSKEEGSVKPSPLREGQRPVSVYDDDPYGGI